MSDEIPDLEPGQITGPRTTADLEFDIMDALGIFTGAAIAGLFVVLLWKFLGTKPDQSYATYYSSGIFLFTPALAGFISAVAANWNGNKSSRSTWLNIALLSVASWFALLVTGVEGSICVFMALPITFPCMALGTFAGRLVMQLVRNPRKILVSAAPIVLGVGIHAFVSQPGYETRTETTTIIVNAPPEKIWPYLFKLSDLPKPDQMLFKTGIAYTLGTRSGGRNVGDARECILTTGVMKETISAVETNRYLRFDVLNTPPSMKESNPFYDIHPRHEQGCFKVHWGEFRLEPLPGGRTKFTGTSRYSYNIYPAEYWRLWTDTVAEQIHVRMMNEIKRRVE